jgi:glycosyltransferase involved in cell wall biosynthesis
MPSVFFAFRDAPERRAALRESDSLDRYRLFGLDELAARGAVVRHNLERSAPPAWARLASRMANAGVPLGGDFAAVLPALRRMNASDVVFSTVDTVGIPLLLLRRARLLRVPLVYASIGLPERLERLRARDGFRRVLGAAHTVIAYSAVEAERLRKWLAADAPTVVFVPFGVDVDAFRPSRNDEPSIDVLAVGADPHRDFGLLTTVAARQPKLAFHLVASRERIHGLGALPPNVVVETDVSLETVRERFAQARVVALPVRANSYSGATTTLLQAMAMGKPVVVSRTDAIAEGYELEDGVNCRLVDPGNPEAFERATLETLTGADAAVSLGVRARETVEHSFSWERYIDALWEILSAAASGASLRRSPGS